MQIIFSFWTFTGGVFSYLIHGTDIPLKNETNMMGMKMKMLATTVEKL